MHKLTALVTSAAAVTLTFVVAAADDEIERRSTNDVVRGQIVSESTTEIVIKSRAGTTEKIAVNDASRVQYDGTIGLEIRTAELLERSTDYKSAAERFAKAAVGATGNEPAARAAAFGQARTLANLALGDAARRPEAIKSLEAFNAKYPNSRHHFASHELMGRLHMAAGNADSARAAFAELKRAPFPDFKIRAAVLEGRLLMSKGEFDSAVTLFEQIAKENAQSAEAKARQTEAVLAKAECWAQLKKFAEAEALLREVVRATDAENTEMQAAAHNTLGDVLRQVGKPKDALIAYLYVDLICPTQKMEHPRALAAIAQLSEELGQPARADLARAKLRRDYGDTAWGKQAEATKAAPATTK